MIARSPQAQRSLEKLRQVLAKTLKVTPEKLLAAVQPAKQEHLSSIAAMRLPEAAGTELADDEAYLHWRYFERFADAVDLWVVCLEGRVLASIGLEVMDLQPATGAPERIRRLQDVIVSAEYRHLGVGAWLTLEVLARFPDVIAIGSNEQSRSISEKLFQRYEIQRFYKFPLRSLPLLERRLGRNVLSSSASRIIDFVNRKRVSNAVNQATNGADLIYFDDIGQFIDAVADALPRLGAGSLSGLTPMRNPEFLRWRLERHPRRTFQGTQLRNASSGQTLAYLIWSKDQTRPDRRSTDAFLFDLRWDPHQVASEQLQRLVADCIARLYDTDAGILSALATDEQTERLLRQSRFLFRNTDPRFYVHEDSRLEGLSRGLGWNIAYADTDKLDLADAGDLPAADGRESH